MSTSPSAPLFDGLDERTFLTLAQAASLLPGRRPGKRMSGRVLQRWVISGVRGHRLKTTRIGGKHVVRVADLRGFLDAIAAKNSWSERVPSPRLNERRATGGGTGSGDGVANRDEAPGESMAFGPLDSEDAEKAHVVDIQSAGRSGL